MTKLTQAQQDMLRRAAESPDAAINGPDDKGLKATAGRLIKAGLLMSMPIDGGCSRLLITEAGKAAIGLAQEPVTTRRSRSKPSAPKLDEAKADAPLKERGVPSGKLGILVGLLRQAGGATVPQLMNATGWQAHSVRGAISGSVKKKLGFCVASEMMDKVRRYRIVESA